MITLAQIWDESTRLLKLFHARPAVKDSMGKVVEEVLEYHTALIELDRRPMNFILKQDAAKEAADVMVTVCNAYYAMGGTVEELEMAMEFVFDKNRKKNETTHIYDGKTIKKIQPVAHIESGE